jgi:hypothetical protein
MSTTTDFEYIPGLWIPQVVVSAEVDESKPFSIFLTFADGYRSGVSLVGRGTGPLAVVLRDPTLFRGLSVDPDAGTITWPNGYDVDPDRLRMLAIEQHPEDMAAIPRPLR